MLIPSVALSLEQDKKIQKVVTGSFVKPVISRQPPDLGRSCRASSLISEQIHWSSSPPLVFTWRGENNSNSFQLYNSDEMSVAEDNPPWFLFQSFFCLLSLTQCVSGDYSKLCFATLRPENCQMMIPPVISQNAVWVHLTLLWKPKG